MSIINSFKVPSIVKKIVLPVTLALATFSQKPYLRADEPSKPVEEMNQKEFEAKRKADAENMRLAEEAAEKAEQDRILEDLKREIAEAEAEKAAEARKLQDAQEQAAREQTEAQSKARIGDLLPGANTQLPASRLLNRSHFEIHGAYDFKNKGFDGAAALQFGLGKGFRGYVEIDGMKRKLVSGNAEGDQQNIGAYLGLTSDDFKFTLNNQYGSTTLDDSFTGSEDISPTLVSTTNSSHDESDSEFLQSANVEYHVKDILNIGLRGTRIKGVEKSDDKVSVHTLGTVPNPFGGDILIDETAEAEANVRTNTNFYSGQAFIEGKLAKGFALHGRFRFVENNIETKLNGDTVIDEKERRIQGLLRARFGGDWAQVVLDGGYQKMLDGQNKSRNSTYLGAADVSLRFHDQVLGQISGWHDENRQYGGSAALALGQKTFGNSALSDFARDGEALRDVKSDDSLTARQRVLYGRLMPERFIKNNDGAVFRFTIDGDGQDHHLYSADAAVSTSKLIDGTSLHAGFTGGRGYKNWFGKLNVEFSDTFSAYLIGQHEQDSITDTRSTAIGVGVVIDFGPSESDK